MNNRLEPAQSRQEQITEESLLDFLQATELPLVSRLGVLVQRVTLGLTACSLVYGIAALVAFEAPWWNAALPWGGALPALLAAPIYFAAWRLARGRRLQAAGQALFLALFVLSALASWPQGAFNTAWYVQPILALLAATCLGVIPGLLLTLFAVIVVLTATQFSVDVSLGVPAEAWVHSVSLSALTLASALTGTLVHKVLLAALLSVESQRHRNSESERALRYRERLLRHAMRVETVGDLAGMVTHQLRNAWQVMLGHASFAAMDQQEAMQRLELVAETLRQSRPLLDQLMSLAHPNEGEPQPGDLSNWVRTFCERARRVMPIAITIDLAVCAHPLSVMINPAALEHALWNLAINARQAMPEGGTLSMTTGLQDGLAFVAVADTGCGIPADIQKKVFDPYFTTKPPGEGTGLGLAAVERFVRASQGHIHLRSKPGAGATFVMFFPVVASASVQSA